MSIQDVFLHGYTDVYAHFFDTHMAMHRPSPIFHGPINTHVETFVDSHVHAHVDARVCAHIYMRIDRHV